MKKSKLTRLIAISLISTSILVFNSIGASAEWKSDSNGWWYAESDTYVTGWKTVEGKWYYFNSDGYMVHDTVIDGCKIGSDGAWIQETVLATIGDEKITKDDFDKQMKLYDVELKKQYGNDYANNSSIKDQLAELKKEQLENLIGRRIVLKKASELNIKPSDDEINKQINETINKYNIEHPGEDFSSAVQKKGITIDEAKANFRDSIIISAVQKNIVKDINVSDDEVLSYYNKYKDTQFTVGAGASVSHILVSDEATAKSLKVKLDAGADFAVLAKENSTDPGSKYNGGSLGFIPYNSTEYISEFMNGFKNLKEGQVSEPVKSKFGYHLIKATGLKAGEAVPLDSVKDKIKSALLKQKQETAIKAKINEWGKALSIKIQDDML